VTEAALPPTATAPDPAPAEPPPAAAPAAVSPPAVAPPAARMRLRGLDPATRRQTFIVAAVIAVLFYGTQILNEAIPASAKNQVPAGDAVAIGASARITPLGGWLSTPHDSGTGIRLEKGVVVIDIYPETAGGTAGALATVYLEQVLKKDASQLTTTDTEVATTTNGSAARFAYQGMFSGVDTALEGEVTAIFVGDQGVIADAWSRQGDLASLLDEVHAMLETIEVTS
jgi:hypothetical protein